jgi:hypothetical protein
MNKRIVIATTLAGLFALSSAPAHAAILQLKPFTQKVSVGTVIDLTLNLNPTGEKIIGTDVFLKYDPAVLEIIEIKSLPNAFSSQPAAKINNPSGDTRFSLINGYGVYLADKKDIATIRAKVLKLEDTTVSFDFTPGNTADTNVVIDDGIDVLNQVQALKLNLTKGNSSNTTSTTVTATSVTNPSSSSTTALDSDDVLGLTDEDTEETATDSATATGSAIPITSLSTNPDFVSPLPGEVDEIATPAQGKILGITDPSTAKKILKNPIFLTALSIFLVMTGLVILAYVIALHRRQARVPAASNQKFATATGAHPLLTDAQPVHEVHVSY